MQLFWVSYHLAGVTVPTGKSVYDLFQIVLPNVCPHCGKLIVIADHGSPTNSGAISVRSCLHTNTYAQLWEMRIEPAYPAVPTCILSCQKCKTTNEYAVANTPDGSYICYSCRR